MIRERNVKEGVKEMDRRERKRESDALITSENTQA